MQASASLTDQIQMIKQYSNEHKSITDTFNQELRHFKWEDWPSSLLDELEKHSTKSDQLKRDEAVISKLENKSNSHRIRLEEIKEKMQSWLKELSTLASQDENSALLSGKGQSDKQDLLDSTRNQFTKLQRNITEATTEKENIFKEVAENKESLTNAIAKRNQSLLLDQKLEVFKDFWKIYQPLRDLIERLLDNVTRLRESVFVLRSQCRPHLE